MKYAKYLAPAFLSLLLAVGAFAADKNQGKITVSQTVTVNGTQLAPGSYKLQWDGSGPDVQVKFVRDGKDVVTAPAKLVTKEAAAPYDSVIVKSSGADSKTLEEINFRNQKLALTFSPAQNSTGN
jgi:type 1 fimbria pilin